MLIFRRLQGYAPAALAGTKSGIGKHFPKGLEKYQSVAKAWLEIYAELQLFVPASWQRSDLPAAADFITPLPIF